MPSSEIAQIKQDRQRLRQEHAAGASGLSIARGLSDSADRAIASIWERLEPPSGTTLVALGGYGRGLLSPASDIDLFVLHQRRKTAEAPAKALAYELWDAGLELGYAIHTPKEALRLSKSRLDSLTAFLDARHLAGDRELYDEWIDAALARTRKSRDFIERLETETTLRRARAGDAGAELEPNLKEGRGGLRDLATLGWIAKITGESSDAPALQAASDFLLRVRNELHFSTGRRIDVLSTHLQDSVARAIVGERGDVAREDELMRTLYFHCRAVAFALDSIFDRLLGRRREPGIPLEFLEFEHGVGKAWDEALRSAFVDTLRWPDAVRSRFEELEQSRILNRIIPEWEAINCLPQRNVYHRYAVDVHSVEVVAHISGLKESKDELVRAVASEVLTGSADERVLLLSGLLHDIGKGGAEDHAATGEELARRVVERMGLDHQEREDVAWLVRNHLLLAEAATRRDIRDEKMIVELADKIGTHGRLRLLFLLTVADALATSPAGWTPWKSTLVSRLFTRVGHLMEGGDLAGEVAGATAQERVEELHRALEAYPGSQVDHHLQNMPRQWLLNQPLPVLVAQSELMIEPVGHDEVRLRAVPQSEAGIWEVTVVARDRPGLFSKLSGSLALHGLNVVGADIFTREDGVALDVFRVEALGDEERRFDKVADDARKAIRGRLSLDVHLAEKRKSYAARPPKGKREPPRVVVDSRSSDFYTIIEVHATDRIGLLYTITRVLSDLSLDIHLAKIATYAEDVVDVFYVRDLEGQKIDDPEHVSEIERTILYRLSAE